MSRVVAESHFPSTGSEVFSAGRPDPSVRAAVWSMLTTLHASPPYGQQRREERFPYPRLVHIVPLDSDGRPLAQGERTGVGKHISTRGLGFYHLGPLHERLAIVTVECTQQPWKRFLMQLRWCRFVGHNWYESGGRFLRLLPDGLDPHQELTPEEWREPRRRDAHSA
jgi:hypothetical protein